MKSVTQMRLGAAMVAAAVLAACGGGTNAGFGAPGDATANLRATNPVTAPVTYRKHKGKRGKAKISIRIPLKKKRGHRMHPDYISPSTQSMAVATTGNVPTQTFNLTPASAGCTTSGNTLTCTKTAFLPPGQQTLTITLYDQQNGTGNQLSTASTPATIAAGAVTNLSITLDGVPAEAAVLLGATPSPNLSIPQGTPTSVPVSVTAKDADGNIIMSPGNYASPVTLSDSDASGATSLSATSVAAPGASVTLSYTGGSLGSATITPSVNGTAQPSGAAVLTLTSTEPGTTSTYQIDTTAGATPGPDGIVAGPDGALWFTEYCGNAIGRMSTDGSLTAEYTLPAAPTGFRSLLPTSIVAGPDGALWFATNQDAQLAGYDLWRITTTGTITSYSLPGNASGLTVGPDGNLWWTLPVDSTGNPSIFDNEFGKMTTSGTYTAYFLPTNYAEPTSIVTGADGALWITESGFPNISPAKIARVTTDGTTTNEYPLPQPTSLPRSIVAGPDDALWFVEEGANQIGRITTSGQITEYPVPTSGSGLGRIAVGPDGALWFTEANANKIGRITTGGTITEYPVATSISGVGPVAITAAPNGEKALWFAMLGVYNQYGGIQAPHGNDLGVITTGNLGPSIRYRVKPILGAHRPENGAYHK